MPELAARLWAGAAAMVAADGRVADAVDDSGRVRAGSTRLWPHAEATRAATLPLAAAAAPHLRPRALLDTLQEHHLGPAPPGCWTDRYDEAGRPASDTVPARSLYHIVGAALHSWAESW